MAGWMLMSSLFLSSVAISLCDYLQCKGGDVTLTANQCTDPMEVFNSSVRVLPGTNVTLNCSVVDTGVQWDSSVFTDPIRIDSSVMSANESGITFQFGSLTLSPVCSDATATISNIQDSVDGLDVRCFTDVMMGFSSTVLIDVIDPPPPFDFSVTQYLSDIVISWDPLSNQLCPIINYTITINGSTMSVPGSITTYRHLINENECTSTVQINMSATSAAGTGNPTTMTFTPEIQDMELQHEIEETSTDAANITVVIRVDNFTHVITDSGLSLSPNSGSGGGMCNVTNSSSQSLDLICTGLSRGTSYTLTINPSVGAPCHHFLIQFELTITDNTTPPPTTDSGSTPLTTSTQRPEEGSSIALIAGASVGAVVGILLIIIVFLAVLCFCFKKKTRKATLDRKRKDDTDGPIALVEKKNPKTGQVSTYDDPAEVHVQKEVHHKEAPTGDTYAIPDKSSGRRAAPSTPGQFEAMTYQDPETIQRQEAPSGDMYAVVNKETSKPVYSEVHKPQDTRVYADLALSEGGISQPGRQPTSQEVFYSQVQSQVHRL